MASQADSESQAAFARWWHEEGSGMAPRAGEDQEMHARRVAEIAWLNGWYLASLHGEKDKLLLDSGTIMLSSMGERIHYVGQDLRTAIEAGMREANKTGETDARCSHADTPKI